MLFRSLEPGTAPLQAGSASQLSTGGAAGPAVCVELAFASGRGTPSPGERTRLFRHAVHEVLRSSGQTDSDPWALIDRASKKIKVAIYAGGGSSTTPGLAAYPACLDRAAEEIAYTYVGPAELALLRPGAHLVNVGRGQLIDEPALVDALTTGHLGAAALDVFAVEPLPIDSPLWTLPNVLVTPHTAGATPLAAERAAQVFQRNLTRWAQGEQLLNLG